MKRLLVLAPRRWFLLAALGALLVPAASQADVTRTFFIAKTPISFNDVNPCDGDLVFLDGTMAEVLNEVTDPNGATHGTYNLTLLDFGGRDANGNEIRLVGGSHAVVNVDDPHSVQFFSLRQMIVSPGPGNNYEIDVVMRAVVNDQGELVVSVDQSMQTCK